MDDLTDVGPVLEDFAASYTVTRPGAVDWNSLPGQPVLGTPTTIAITGVLLPVSNKDLQRLPEGFRVDGVRSFYTETPLQLAPQPDLVSAEGLTWQVEALEPWAAGGFYKALLRKVG